MKVFLPLIFLFIASGCSAGGPINKKCSTVMAVKASSNLCSGHSIQIRAYLISTRHGEYLVDKPSDANVLSVEFSESKLHAKSTSALLEKLGRANKGKPFASVYGTFEGRLVVDKSGDIFQFEIYTEVRKKNPAQIKSDRS